MHLRYVGAGFPELQLSHEVANYSSDELGVRSWLPVPPQEDLGLRVRTDHVSVPTDEEHVLVWILRKQNNNNNNNNKWKRENTKESDYLHGL